jgi:hypothetical protein
MSAALYIELEENTGDIGTFVDGKHLSQAEPVLSHIAVEAGVKPLMQFFGASGDEYADIFDHAGVELPEAKWFDASEGLQTIRVLLSNVEQNQDKFASADALLADLKNFERVLMEAEEKQLRWHLAVDF